MMKVGRARGFWGLAAGACAAVLLAPTAGAAVEYRVELLDAFSPRVTAWGRAVNDSGAVAGDAQRNLGGGALDFPAVRWDAGATSPTPMVGSLDAIGWGINNAGDVTGQALVDPRYGYVPARWGDGGTTFTQLAGVGRIPRAINDRGDVVGYGPASQTGQHGDRAYRWAGGGTAATELGNLGTTDFQLFGWSNVYAYSINETGDAVGWAEKYVSGVYKGSRAVVWPAGATAAVELLTLGVSPSGNTGTEAFSINNLGDVVGNAAAYSGTNALGKRAVVWHAGGLAPIELPNLGLDVAGNPSTSAIAINDAGDIVGTATRYVNGTQVASGPALWRADGTGPFLLSELIDPESNWVLNDVTGIGGNGAIVGNGFYDPDGAGPLARLQAPFRLVPVPEPGGVLMVGLGACLLGRRRRAGGRDKPS
jgi:hypothetical protein